MGLLSGLAGIGKGALSAMGGGGGGAMEGAPAPQQGGFRGAMGGAASGLNSLSANFLDEPQRKLPMLKPQQFQQFAPEQPLARQMPAPALPADPGSVQTYGRPQPMPTF